MRSVLVALAVAAAACTIGPRIARYPPATTPHGVTVRLRSAPRLEGELLAVDDSALTMFGGSEIWLVRYRHITGIVIVPRDDIHFGGRPPGAKVRERLRLASRFPQGLDESLRARLLRANAQAALRVYAP